MILGYLRLVLGRFQVAWDDFWFQPSARETCTRLRMLLAIVSAIWFASWLSQTKWYFGEHGWLKKSLIRELISQTQESWRASFSWTPLWFAEGEMIVMGYQWIGILLSLVVLLGVGGRVSTALLWIWIIGLGQRLAWVASTTEPILAAFVGYLMFYPGRSLLSSRDATPSARSWLARMPQRLIQCHCWLLIATAMFSQLANPAWWQGDAVWWLAATGRSHVLTSEMLRGNILLVNALTHAIVLLELGTLVLLFPKLTRPLGIGLGFLVSLSYAFVADQWLYGILLAVGLTAFYDDQIEDVFAISKLS